MRLVNQIYVKLVSNLKSVLSLVIVAFFICGFKFQSEISKFTKVAIMIIYFLAAVTQFFADYFKFVCLCRGSYKSDQYFNGLQPTVKVLIKLILTYVIVRETIQNFEKIIISLLIIGLHLAKIWKLIKDKIQRQDPFLEAVNYISWIFVICYYCILLLEMDIRLVRQNYWSMLFSLTIWSGKSLYNTIEYFKISLLLKQIMEITNENQALAYIRLLFDTYDKRTQTSKFFLFFGLIKAHSDSCKNISCICKKNSNLEETTQYQKQEFFLLFMQNSFKILAQRFNCKQIKITFHAFKVFVMKQYLLYFYESDLFKKELSHMNLIQKLYVQQIYREALKQFNKKIQAEISIKHYINKVFDIESKIDNCYIKMEKIVSSFASLFTKNSRKHCSLIMLKKQLCVIYKGLTEISQLYGQQKIQQTISLELSLLMLFFFRGIFSFSFYTKPIFQRLQFLYKQAQISNMSHQKFDITVNSVNGCVIESALESKSFGLVTKVSSNAAKIFKYPTLESMFNLDIGRLLPRFMRDEYRCMLQQWITHGSLKNINRLIQTFGVTYKENVFKAIIKAQLAVIGNKIVMLFGIIILDDDNYMLIDKNDQIDSFGLDFSKIMANKQKLLRAEFIYPNWGSISKQLTQEPITIRTTYNQIYHNQLPQTKFIQNKNQNVDFEQNDSAQLKYMVIQANVCYFRKQKFYVIRKMTNFSGNKSNKWLASVNSNEIKKAKISNQSFNASANQMIGRYLAQILTPEIESVASSSKKQAFFSVQKLFQSLQKRAVHQRKQLSPLLINTIIGIVTIYILILLTKSIQVFIMVRSLSSFNQVIYADAAVSDNMQMLQITYNNIIRYQHSCLNSTNPSSCKLLASAARIIQNNLTELLALDIEDMIKNQTFYKNRYFIYQLSQVKLKLNENGQSRVVTAYQFMQYFILNSKYLFQLIQSNKTQPNNTRHVEIIKNIEINWQEMKRINHQNIDLYQEMGEQQIYTTNIIIYCISAIYWILVTLYMAVLCKYNKINEQFANKMLILYRYIPVKVSQKLQQYYNKILTPLKKRNLKQLIKLQHIYFQQQNLRINLQYTLSKNHTRYFYIFLSWLMFLMFNIFITYNVLQLNLGSQNILTNINQLMNSQNYMLENYFQMKQLCLYGLQDENFQQKLNKLVDNFNITMDVQQNQFVKTALNTISITAKLNQNVVYAFSDLVAKDICEALVNIIGPEQIESCMKSMQYKLLQESILSVMTFFQSIILETGNKLKNVQKDKKEAFKYKIFEDLDKYLYYCFRMFQTTQVVMLDSLNQISNQQLAIIISVVGIQLFMQTFFIAKWLYQLQKRRWETNQGYAYALIYPVCVAKNTKFVQQTLIKLV